MRTLSIRHANPDGCLCIDGSGDFTLHINGQSHTFAPCPEGHMRTTEAFWQLMQGARYAVIQRGSETVEVEVI